MSQPVENTLYINKYVAIKYPLTFRQNRRFKANNFTNLQFKVNSKIFRSIIWDQSSKYSDIPKAE